jgi:hypothetical protein
LVVERNLSSSSTNIMFKFSIGYPLNTGQTGLGIDDRD